MSLHLIHFIVSVVKMLLMNVVQGWLEIPYFPVYKSTGVLANLATDTFES